MQKIQNYRRDDACERRQSFLKTKLKGLGDPQLLTMLWKNRNLINQHGCQLSVSKATRNHVTSLT